MRAVYKPDSKMQTEAARTQNSEVAHSAHAGLVRDISTLIGAPAFATDGETGRVRDFLFDDQSWRIRFLVLDAGNWLRRRDVILPASALELPDWQSRTLRVRLTSAEVRKCPDIDSEKPVYRQQELAMREYFGALACWIDAEYGLGSGPSWVKYPSLPGEDSHLRSVRHLIGYRVRAAGGYVGRLNGFLMDKDNWRLSYAEAGASHPQHRTVAVPIHQIDRISWAEFRIYLHPRSAAAPS
jgi:hypothetical protein